VERKTNDSIRQHDVALETKKLIESLISSISKKRGAISEVEFIGGSAQATSFISHNVIGCRPDNAFVRVPGDLNPFLDGARDASQKIKEFTLRCFGTTLLVTIPLSRRASLFGVRCNATVARNTHLRFGNLWDPTMTSAPGLAIGPSSVKIHPTSSSKNRMRRNTATSSATTRTRMNKSFDAWESTSSVLITRGLVCPMSGCGRV